MTPMRKVMLFGALIMAPLVIALIIWLVITFVTAQKAASFLSAYEKIHEAKPPLSVVQVEQLMGQPLRIEQSESADQTVSGQVYHYATYPSGGDFQVIFVNGVVFHTALPIESYPHSGNQLILDVLTGKA